MSTYILARHHPPVWGIFWEEGVGRMVWEYLLWVGLTVLAAVALGRLKRWLLILAEKKNRPEN